MLPYKLRRKINNSEKTNKRNSAPTTLIKGLWEQAAASIPGLTTLHDWTSFNISMGKTPQKQVAGSQLQGQIFHILCTCSWQACIYTGAHWEAQHVCLTTEATQSHPYCSPRTDTLLSALRLHVSLVGPDATYGLQAWLPSVPTVGILPNKSMLPHLQNTTYILHSLQPQLNLQRKPKALKERPLFCKGSQHHIADETDRQEVLLRYCKLFS